MEGLIPYIIDAIRKQKKASHSHTDRSERSYHMLLGSDSFNGSSHSHIRSSRSELLDLVSPTAAAAPTTTTSSRASNNLRNLPAGGSLIGYHPIETDKSTNFIG
ncbi:hypothetical protein CR513_17987, partial [Mucuna pruriens]